jgi:2-amino-4-hydroxy-6-hydroxymethyldihydropteridine diphosphokinase
VVDVDLLLYGDRVVRESAPWLEIPHPELWNRLFVLVPLAELRPDLVGPDGAPIGVWIDRLAAVAPAAVRRYPGE